MINKFFYQQFFSEMCSVFLRSTKILFKKIFSFKKHESYRLILQLTSDIKSLMLALPNIRLTLTNSAIYLKNGFPFYLYLQRIVLKVNFCHLNPQNIVQLFQEFFEELEQSIMVQILLERNNFLFFRSRDEKIAHFRSTCAC